jgi:hypothetical protein
MVAGRVDVALALPGSAAGRSRSRAAPIRRRAARALRLRGVAGQREAVDAALAPRRPRRHAHGLGQVALLPAAAHMRTTDGRCLPLTLSCRTRSRRFPRRIAPGAVAQLNAQQARLANRRALDSGGAPATCACRLRRAGALSLRPDSSSGCAAPSSGCSWSTRPLRVADGARLPPTTSGSPMRRAGSAQGDRGVDRDATPRWRTTSVAARAARSGPRRNRVRPPRTVRSSSSPCATKEAGHRGIAAALAEPGALPGDRHTRARSAECDKLSARAGAGCSARPCSPTTPGARA